MKYAILSDVHANLPALEAVLHDMKTRDFSHTVCLGDIVGYGPYPKECVDTIRRMNIPCVKGNFDEYCSSEVALSGFSVEAADQIKWTREKLTEADRAWLRGLPYVQEVSGFTIVHATLNEPQRWGYVFDRAAGAASLARQSTGVCFFGHTHIPILFTKDTAVRGGTYTRVRVESRRQYFINPGSVGQPRDTDSRASYATYDIDEQIAELHRVSFEWPPGESGGTSAPATPILPRPSLAQNRTRNAS